MARKNSNNKPLNHSKYMNSNSTYRKITKIIDTTFLSCFIYYMLPDSAEKKHFHDGFEIEYVIKGSCKTHKQGRLYFRKKGEIHEGINDSNQEVIFVCLTIPAETKENTHYL